MMKTLGAIGLPVVSFLVVCAWASWDAPSLSLGAAPTKSLRDPAAIRKVYDFSSLDGSDLSSASKKRLISGFDVIKEASSTGVSLGHFVVASSDGQKQFACDRYSDVILSFEGEGVAVSGDKPTMEVEGSCNVDNDVNRISPLWIPVAKIMGHPVSEGEFDFSSDPEKVFIRFKNVADQWPSQWVLTKIRLRNSGNRDEVSIDQADLRALMDRPVVLDFLVR